MGCQGLLEFFWVASSGPLALSWWESFLGILWFYQVWHTLGTEVTNMLVEPSSHWGPCAVIGQHHRWLVWAQLHWWILRSVPTTPDPNTSEKVSRYKWEAYRDTNWWCIYCFLPRGGHTFAKVCHRNGRCIAILFKSIGVRGCFDSPEIWQRLFILILCLKTFISCYRTPRHQKVSEGSPKGSLKGCLKGFWRVLPRTCLSRRSLQNAFKNPSKTFQEGVEIDDAFGLPGLQNQFQGPGVLALEMKVLIFAPQISGTFFLSVRPPKRNVQPYFRFAGNLGQNLEGCQMHTHKGHREKVLKFRVFSAYFQGIFRVFSWCFQGVFREFQGSVSSKRCSPPKVFRAFWTHFGQISDAFWTFLSSRYNKTHFDAFLTHFWRISDAFLTHSGYCRRLFQKHLLDDTEGCFQDVFPYALSGYAPWTFPKSTWHPNCSDATFCLIIWSFLLAPLALTPRPPR